MSCFCFLFDEQLDKLYEDYPTLHAQDDHYEVCLIGFRLIYQYSLDDTSI